MLNQRHNLPYFRELFIENSLDKIKKNKRFENSETCMNTTQNVIKEHVKRVHKIQAGGGAGGLLTVFVLYADFWYVGSVCDVDLEKMTNMPPPPVFLLRWKIGGING